MNETEMATHEPTDDELRNKLAKAQERHRSQIDSSASFRSPMPNLPPTFQTAKRGICGKCGETAISEVSLICAACDALVESEFERRRTERRLRSFRRIGIPIDYASGKIGFGDYVPRTDSQHTALAVARAWGAMRSRPILMLSGPVGTGKTHLSACALIAAIDRMNEKPGGLPTAFFTTFDDLIRLLQSTFRSESESEDRELGRRMAADFLVLDDIGVKAPTSYTTGVLYALLNARWEERRATILTTNKTMGELGASIATRDETVQAERILSRLTDRDRVVGVFVQGPDHRRKRN